ncbi:MAG: MFS transporter [Legionellales bacterium]|nr:MFS transporter [Legionellales bacterium]
MNIEHSKLKNGISKNKAIAIYIVVSLFLAFEMAVQVSPSVMAANLMQSLGISAFELGVMSSAYFYSYTSMQIPSGLLFDRFNALTIIVSAVVVCSVGSILFGCVSNFYFGCFARILMGAGSAFAFVSVLVMASKLFESKWFPVLTGITQMLAAFGAMSGQLPISIMVSQTGWRNTMFILGAVGIGLALIISFILRGVDADKTKAELDTKASSTPIRNSLKLIILNPQTWFIGLYACLLWSPMSGFASLWGVPYLEKFDGLTRNSAALYCSMMWLGLAIASPLLGLLSASVKNKVFPLILSSLVGVVSFGVLIEIHLHGIYLIIVLLLSGAACSGQALSFFLVERNNSKKVRATAIAFNNMAVVTSGAIFQPLIGAFISCFGKEAFSSYSIFDFKRGLLLILGAYFISFLLSLFAIKNPGRKEHLVNLKLGREEAVYE